MSEIKATGYTVFIQKNIAKEINRFFRTSEKKYAGIYILMDENSLKYCYPQLVGQIQYFKEAEIFEIESGEENKSLEVCVQIWSTLSEFGAGRDSLFVNLGGGVISDMGGFIASAFKRGIDFINIPTTLLSQVDASIGGKTGIDLNNLKNELGLFCNPSAVFINGDFIKTQDKRQLISGFAEIIKHGLVADKVYWKKIKAVKSLNWQSLEGLIKTSIEIKNKIVTKDPKEAGIRKILNFGHTVGHAIETFSLKYDENKLLHGEAIAAGMICEAYLSYKICKLKKEELEEITGFILKNYKKIQIEKMDQLELIALMKHDKKNSSGEINFSLLTAPGKCVINKTANTELISEALNYYIKA